MWCRLPFSFLIFSFFFFFVFLGPHLQQMEVPRLGVELELQSLVYTTATATWDPSCICNLCHSLWQCGILNPLSKARDWTCIFMDASWVLNLLSHTGTPFHFLFHSILFYSISIYSIIFYSALQQPLWETLDRIHLSGIYHIWWPNNFILWYILRGNECMCPPMDLFRMFTEAKWTEEMSIRPNGRNYSKAHQQKNG